MKGIDIMTNKELAAKIIENIGGEKNISQLEHCATRLRFNLKDDSKANISALGNLEGVLRAQNSSGQLQVVIGAKVNAVYDEVAAQANITSSNNEEVTKVKKNKLSAFVETIAGVFTPMIPVLIGCGMTKSLSSILTNFQLVAKDSSVLLVINMIGDLAFYFLPFFLAVSAAKKFKTNEYVALALAAAYMHPAILDAANVIAKTGVKSIDLFGAPILLVNYKSTVIPIILSVWVMSFVYKKVDEIMPDFLKIIFTAMVVLFIMVPLELIVLGPIGSYAGVWIANFVSWFYSVGGVFSAALLGGTRSILTMFGMHYALAPLQIQQIAEQGSSTLLVSALTANFAQAGAALGALIVLKNKSQKSLAASSSLSAFLGITEPAMYGINLKYKRPFIFALISSAISAGFLSIFNASAMAYAPPGLFTLPTYKANSFLFIIIGVLMSSGLACVLTVFFGISKEDNKAEDELAVEKVKNVEVQKKLTGELLVKSPVVGEVKKLSEVSDTVFGQECMGKGVAIVPSEGKVYAPFDGVVEAFFNTKHAIGLKSKDGLEILIHVGIDTVNLEGKYFIDKVKQGDEVKVGQLLLEFDMDSIKKEGYDIITPVVVTNTENYSDVICNATGSVNKDSLILKIEY